DFPGFRWSMPPSSPSRRSSPCSTASSSPGPEQIGVPSRRVETVSSRAAARRQTAAARRRTAAARRQTARRRVSAMPSSTGPIPTAARKVTLTAPRRPDEIFAAQREYRWVTKASTAAERAAHLTRLREAIVAHLDEIREALHSDLMRPPRPRMPSEVAAVLTDIDQAVAHLEEWMAPAPVTPASFLGRVEAYVQYEARGICLLFAPWNFPFGLLFQ